MTSLKSLKASAERSLSRAASIHCDLPLMEGRVLGTYTTGQSTHTMIG
jgi:hypothetical protein